MLRKLPFASSAFPVMKTRATTNSLLRRNLLVSSSSSSASSASAASSFLVSSRRFNSASATTESSSSSLPNEQKLADASPATPAEERVFSQEVEEQRIDRFVDDMYAQPVFSPLVMLLTTIGFAGFISTWGYFVAMPVYLGYTGQSSEDSGSSDDGSELD